MGIKVADEVWIATALLHRENPNRDAFEPKEIVDRVFKEGLFGRLRPGVIIHVSQHCVADKRPNPGNYRMLVSTDDRKRRLFSKKDLEEGNFHPYREGGKVTPKAADIPEKYHKLLDWWENEYRA